VASRSASSLLQLPALTFAAAYAVMARPERLEFGAGHRTDAQLAHGTTLELARTSAIPLRWW
jgi:ferric-dicitrate binding protein FerR (iron transport regulator)